MLYLGPMFGMLFVHHPDTARAFFGSGNVYGVSIYSNSRAEIRLIKALSFDIKLRALINIAS